MLDEEERRLFEAYRWLLKARWESRTPEKRKQYIRRLMYCTYGCYEDADIGLARVLENLGDDNF